ncbi:hypothetical protein ABZ490_36225 [Streptomyces sp. NPDC005811]|uniref:hypothetical protein n=1 Tax=Streptomyces sp. NPDC005811 TaxID=3154565 RepID=UPI0033DF2E94
MSHRKSKKRPLYVGLAIAIIASGVAVVANASEGTSKSNISIKADEGTGISNDNRLPTFEELMSACGVADVCKFTVTNTEKFLGAEHAVSDIVLNCEPEPITKATTWSDTTSSSTNLGFSLTAGASFLSVLNASMTASVGVGWENSRTSSQTFTETLRPSSKSQVVRATALVRTTGNWEFHFPSRFFGHFFWFINGASFTEEDPSGASRLIFRQRTMTQKESDDACKDFANAIVPSPSTSEDKILQDSTLPTTQPADLTPALVPDQQGDQPVDPGGGVAG